MKKQKGRPRKIIKPLSLGEYLRLTREKVGLSQEQVASEMGWSSGQYVSNWEREKSSPSLDDVTKLSEIYRVTTLELRTHMAEYQIKRLRKKYGVK